MVHWLDISMFIIKLKEISVFYKVITIIAFIMLILSNFAHGESKELKKETKLVEFRHVLDTRKVKLNHMPLHLNAVGKLDYNKRRAFDKAKVRFLKLNCTANLVAPSKDVQSDIILTSKHCLSKERFYIWTSINRSGEKIRRRAKVIYKDEHVDWAILRLSSSVSSEDITPFIVSSEAFIHNNQKQNNLSLYMFAGFSIDWFGRYGKFLTYEENPSFIQVINPIKHIAEIGAITHQGDSGGAIIYKNEVNEWNIVGIMSRIKKDNNLFKSKKGTFGNITGHFVNLTGYSDFFLIFNDLFYE